MNRYYIGSTMDVDERLHQHRNGYYKMAHTAKVDDWELYFELECRNKTQAIQIEQHIKRMKSRKYLVNLKRYPEISDKLRESYTGSSR